MEPKSSKSSSAIDAAAMKAAVAGAEPPAKLTKPVADSKGFKTASWTAMPSPARTVKVEATTSPTPMQSPKPMPNSQQEARTTAARADPVLAQIQHDLAEIRSMLGSLVEAVRALQTVASR